LTSLTDSGSNFFPSWNRTSDSIVFDSWTEHNFLATKYR
jgi:hypothetical protein